MESNDFVITCEFDASQEAVWKALTDAKALAEWWGPAGFTWVRGTLDLKPGGTFHYGMRAPGNGPEMWGKWVFREIVPPTKLVFVNSFADEAGNTISPPFADDWPVEIQNTLTLEERAGKTILTLCGNPINATEAQRETFNAGHSSMQQGFGGTFDQLAAYLARA